VFSIYNICPCFFQVNECVDCHPAEKKTNMFTLMSGMVCPQCHHKRSQRKEIIQEITDTEINYGRDLNILKEVSRKLPI